MQRTQNGFFGFLPVAFCVLSGAVFIGILVLLVAGQPWLETFYQNRSLLNNLLLWIPAMILPEILRLIGSKLKKPDSINPIKRFVKGFVVLYCKMFGYKHYIKKIMKATVKPEQKGNNYVGAKIWCVYGERGIIPAEAFSEAIDIEFEGQMFPAPVGYDKYLTCLYGDYLPEPPKEKQKTHHGFKAYRL